MAEVLEIGILLLVAFQAAFLGHRSPFYLLGAAVSICPLCSPSWRDCRSPS